MPGRGVRCAAVFDLCAVGDFCWDLVVGTDTELPRGGDVMGEIEMHAGGSAANSAVWAARCGASAAFIGAVGTDRLGTLAAEDLAAEGVHHHLVRLAERPTGMVVSFVDHTGERSMITGVGADHLLTPGQLPGDLLAACRHIHVTGWSMFGDPPRAAVVEAVRIAAEAGATVSLDPSAHQMISAMGVAEFLAMTVPLRPAVVFPNRDEGRVLTGAREPRAIAAALGELYPGAVVVLKLDADGALVDGELVPTPPVDVVDTTGAGDSFAGAFLAHWVRGASPIAAARAAVGVAAWVVARVGARPAGWST